MNTTLGNPAGILAHYSSLRLAKRFENSDQREAPLTPPRSRLRLALRPASVAPGTRVGGKEYLRKLRAAEMAAWDAADRGQSSQPSSLGGLSVTSVQAEFARHRWKERGFQIGIVVAAATGLIAALAASSAFMDRWSLFVNFVRLSLS